MIRGYIPGFTKGQKGGPRFGDATVLDDGKHCLVVDGYCGYGTTKLIKWLKANRRTTPYLLISHAHYDHYYGIRKIINDKWFNPAALYVYKPSSINAGFAKAVQEEQKTLQAIIDEARARKIPIRYIDHGSYKIGEIRFKAGREQPKTAGNSDEYLNNGSLCLWFPDLLYFTSGDGPDQIFRMCKKMGARPKFFKIPHHGNACDRTQSAGMKTLGAKFCWDNDISTSITFFLTTGRLRCQQAGIKWFSCIGDINIIAQNGKVSIYKDGGVYRYVCPYKGKTALHSPRVDTVRAVIRGDYGKDNARTTNLIDAGFYPVATQTKANKVISTAKGIMEGRLNYGKGAVRIAKVDSLLGIGYGQLVQDYIDILAGVRKKL